MSEHPATPCPLHRHHRRRHHSCIKHQRLHVRWRRRWRWRWWFDSSHCLAAQPVLCLHLRPPPGICFPPPFHSLTSYFPPFVFCLHILCRVFCLVGYNTTPFGLVLPLPSSCFCSFTFLFTYHPPFLVLSSFSDLVFIKKFAMLDILLLDDLVLSFSTSPASSPLFFFFLTHSFPLLFLPSF